MPKSRKRRSSRSSRKQRPRPKRQGSPQRRTVATIRQAQSIEPLLTESDRWHMAQQVEAAARGDAQASLEHHLAGLVVEEAPLRHQLQELADLGADAPAWMYSRWAVDQAYGWMLLSRDPRTDDVVELVLRAVHFDHLAGIAGDRQALGEYATAVAASDWLCQQLAVYEAGGLADFLDVKAEHGLISRADQVRDWGRAAMDAYEVVGFAQDAIEVRRLSDDARLELLNLGAASEAGPGGTVLGRVVPVSVWPFAMFESRPLVVDRETAEDAVARCAEGDEVGWLWALAKARQAGRLRRLFSCGGGGLLSSDLAPLGREDVSGDPAPRVADLMADGVSRRAAEGVSVAELALVVAHVSPDGVGAVVPHLNAVLLDRETFETCKRECTSPEHAELWRALAVAIPSPVRERCEQLAALSGGDGRLAS